MKKYIQISIVLGIFFLLVLFRQLRGSSGDQPVVSQPMITQPQNNSSPTTAPTNPQSTSTGNYKNGTYTGSVEDAYYGNIQVQAVISNGKISDVIFLQYPNDRGTSRSINDQAMPMLKSEAIQAQSAQVDIISGASDSSAAFQKSLGSALQKAG